MKCEKQRKMCKKRTLHRPRGSVEIFMAYTSDVHIFINLVYVGVVFRWNSCCTFYGFSENRVICDIAFVSSYTFQFGLWNKFAILIVSQRTLLKYITSHTKWWKNSLFRIFQLIEEGIWLKLCSFRNLIFIITESKKVQSKFIIVS